METPLMAFILEKCYKENANYRWVISLELSIQSID